MKGWKEFPKGSWNNPYRCWDWQQAHAKANETGEVVHVAVLEASGRWALGVVRPGFGNHEVLDYDWAAWKGNES